jgi:hypothetical protein
MALRLLSYNILAGGAPNDIRLYLSHGPSSGPRRLYLCLSLFR